MNYSISPDSDLKIIRYKHTGKLKQEDIGKAWEEFLQMDEFVHQGYHLFSDYRDAIFDMDMEEVYQIVDKLKAMGQVLDGKKQSIIVTDPYSTAGSILFEEIVKSKINFKIKIFSTENAALKWLLK